MKPAAPHAANLRVFLGAAAVFTVLSALAGLTSQGFLEADGITHYLIARFALFQPHYFLDVWGRPLYTAIYCVPAALGGVVAVRLTSLALALVCAAITYRIAQKQGYPFAGLAALFLLAQPLFFLHSFSELTELPFAVLLAAAFWAYQGRQFFALAVLASLAPLSRPEGVGVLLVVAAALFWHRRWYYLVVLALPLVLWSYFGWVMWGRPQDMYWWQWLLRNQPYSAHSVYGHGSLFHYLWFLPAITGPLVLPFVAIGAARSLRHQPLIALIPLCVLLTHTLLWWGGLMASSGELRYLLIAAPFWALLAASGWQWFFERFSLGRPIAFAAAAATLPLLVNAIYPVVPLRFTDCDLLAKEFADSYRSDSRLRQDYPRVMSSMPQVFYFLDISPSDPKRSAEWNRAQVQSPPAGGILVWDWLYAMHSADRTRVISRQDVEAAGWIPLRQLTRGQASAQVFISPTPAPLAE